MYLTDIVEKRKSLRGRDTVMQVPELHHVLNTPIKGPFDENLDQVMFGLGCFWGAERLFWQQEGVFSTAVGYAGGYTPNPLYEEVCSGMTGHTEVVRVIYDRKKISFTRLLSLFWQEHDPTQGLRQGNDKGSQYRSAIYVNHPDDFEMAETSKSSYQRALSAEGFGVITTEVRQNVTFYFAEAAHQQYLHKHPNGYCGLKGTGIGYPE